MHVIAIYITFECHVSTGKEAAEENPEKNPQIYRRRRRG